jgi:hypothetical protein
MSEQYFVDAKSFKPERWLGPDSAELEKRLVSFSRGSRSCLGVKYANPFTVLIRILLLLCLGNSLSTPFGYNNYLNITLGIRLYFFSKFGY